MKRKLLYISSITPDTTSGAHIAIYRHLIYKKDFDIAVAAGYTDKVEVADKFTIQKSKLGKRISHTRFARFYYNLEYFFNWYILPGSLLEYAKRIKPDCIFIVPDNTHPGLAFQLAKKLNIPLVVDFQDLFPLSRFIPDFMEPYSFSRKFLLRKFFKLNKEADYVFYTSEGMKQFFESRPDSAVLYPVGDFERKEVQKIDGPKNNEFTILYAGNCYGAYGRMLLTLAKKIKDTKGIHLNIFPVGKGWSDEDIKEMTEAGIYRSFMPFNELRMEFAKADAFLTVMSFEEEQVPFVSTSFTTKWLDYAQFGKPVISWAPEYASSTIFAKLHQSAIFIEEDNADEVVKKILAISEADVEFYSNRSKEIASMLFEPNNIHEIFVKGINTAIDAK